MNIAGAKDLRVRSSFELPGVMNAAGKPIAVELEALPFGWDVDFLQQCPPPGAPMKMVGHKKGDAVWAPDKSDSTYQQKSSMHEAMKAAAMIYIALRPSRLAQIVTFDTDEALLAKPETAAKFWQGIYTELRESGWPLQRALTLIGKIGELGTDNPEEVEDAARDFSSSGTEGP